MAVCVYVSCFFSVMLMLACNYLFLQYREGVLLDLCVSCGLFHAYVIMHEQDYVRYYILGCVGRKFHWHILDKGI